MREKTSYEERRKPVRTVESEHQKTRYGSYTQLSKFQQKEFAHLYAVSRREQAHKLKFPGKS